MRLVHISDPHLALARPPAGNCKQVLGWLNWLVNRRFRHRGARLGRAAAQAAALAPDVVLLTGDLTQTGRAAEAALARAYLAPLLAARVPVLLLAGNHDRYPSSPRVSRAWDELRRELAGGLDVDAAGVVALAETQILLLEQARPTPVSQGWGEIGEEQLAGLRERLRATPAPRLRIAAGHYPLLDRDGGPLPRARCLRGAPALREFLADCKVSHYFCGHLHREFERELAPGCTQHCAVSVTAVASPPRLYEL